MNNIKAHIKKIVTYLSIEKFALSVYRLISVPFLFWVRLNVRIRVGAKKWKTISKLRIVSWPNILNKPYSILQGSYTIEKILLAIGLRAEGFSKLNSFSLFSMNTTNRTIFINWQDLTQDECNFVSYLTKSFATLDYSKNFLDAKKINSNCNDISKKRVGKIFEETFMYSLNVDPTNCKGKIVMKSDENGKHDGKIIDAPLERSAVRQENVYNVLINNIEENDKAKDYRIPFIGELSKFCYQKTRPILDRFTNENIRTEVLKTKDVFDQEEINKISHFCKLMRLDYGELDCLRDINSGKIYVLDVNKTPTGPPHGISLSNKLYVIIEMSTLFIENFCRKP